jgi:pimeloyl-ACP methyl ester carboxylesterase
MTAGAIEAPFAAADPATFDLAGPSGAPVIVFVHGTRLTRGMWAAQVRDLADTYRVAALDLPGHGALADQPFSLDAAADQVAAVIAAVATPDDRRAVVVGLSLGGYVGMHVAARHPGLVRGLVLSGSTAEPVAWRSMPYRGLAWVMERFEGRRLDALNAWFFRTRFPPDIAEPLIAGGFWFRGGADALRSLVGQSFVSRLAAYDGPTLFINGTWDLPFRLSARTFARAARRPRRVRLGGATHLANLDRPAAFDAAIRRFMVALDGASEAVAEGSDGRLARPPSMHA